MIVGIGIDTVDIARIEERISNIHFVGKVFSSYEVNYCMGLKYPAQHFAARFAAKEAFLKAAGTGLTLSFELSHIEIRTVDEGRPEIILEGKFSEIKREQDWKSIHVSLTHAETTASAIVIIEK